MASGATCVQRLDGSRDSAIHTKYRISLRSSSMREPRYPLPRVVLVIRQTPRLPLPRSANGAVGGRAIILSFPWRFPRRGWVVRPRDGRAGSDGEEGGKAQEGLAAPPPAPGGHNGFAVVCSAGFDNDPSAGSPTETLLRLLLPLNDKVQWTSRDVAGSEPPTSPRSEHFTGPFNR